MLATFSHWISFLLSTHVRRFLLVGSVGFIVDLAVLGVLVHVMYVDAIVSRFIAFISAITITYMGNARYTFEMRPAQARYGRYIAVQVFGAVINLGVYTWLILNGLLTSYPMIALACGAMIATFSNFLLSRRYVFKAHG